jgi:hypothetical protein
MSAPNRHFLFSCLSTDLSEIPSQDKKSPASALRSVAATMLLESVFKKFEDPNPKADAKAIEKFLAVNERMGSYKLVVESSWDEEVIGNVKTCLERFLHPEGVPLVDSFQQLFEAGELGPGASIAGRGGDFYTKMFSSELTTTGLPLYAEYRSNIKNLTSWSEAENLRFTKCRGPVLVEGNRLSLVPKNIDISRTICTEPTLNMWYQLGLGNVIRERLRSFFGIDLRHVADINRHMARLGSLDQDGPGSFSTIDLESASDSISLTLVDELFPQWFSSILKYLRSPVSRLPDGSALTLNMVSTMGNGFTFPLQTLLFAAVVSAVYAEKDSRRKPYPLNRVNSENPNWSVFGDDIIVRSDAYDRVVHVLNLLGFRVNAEKSFNKGPFRESCGCDFFKGHMVRGVYLKHLTTAQDTYVAFNKLVRWSARNKISLDSTLQYLLRKAPFLGVPFWESDDAGFKVPEWWPWLKTKRENGGMYYKASVPKARQLVLTDDNIKVPRGLRSRVYNPEGLIVSITRGEWTDGVLSVRHRMEKRYIRVRRFAPSWYEPPVSELPDYVGVFDPNCLWPNGRFNWFRDLRYELEARRAVAPIAGAIEGRRCETVFWSLLE